MQEPLVKTHVQGSQYQFFQVLSPVTSRPTGQVSFPRGRLQLEVYSTSTWTKCDLSDSRDKSGSSDLNLDFEMFFILLSSLVLIILIKWGFERRAKFHILANYGYNVSWTVKYNICKRQYKASNLGAPNQLHIWQHPSDCQGRPWYYAWLAWKVSLRYHSSVKYFLEFEVWIASLVRNTDFCF